MMKRILSSLLCAAMLLAALTALVSCGGDGISGTYYNESGDLYLKLSGGKWSMGEVDGAEVLSGPYAITEGVISFRMSAQNGEELEAFTGKVEGKQLTMYFQGDAGSTVFYRE